MTQEAAHATKSLKFGDASDDYKQFLPEAEAAVEKWNSENPTKVDLVKIVSVQLEVFGAVTTAYMVLQVAGKPPLEILFNLKAVVRSGPDGITVVSVGLGHFAPHASAAEDVRGPGPVELPLQSFPRSPTDPAILSAANFAASKAPGFGIGRSLGEVYRAESTMYVPMALIEYKMVIKVLVYVSLRRWVKPLEWIMEVVVDERGQGDYSLVSSKLLRSPPKHNFGQPVPASVNDPRVIAAAKFGVRAVGEQLKGGATLSTIRGAMTQPVAGTVYYLVVDAFTPFPPPAIGTVLSGMDLRVFESLEGEYTLAYYDMDPFDTAPLTQGARPVLLGGYQPVDLTEENVAILNAAGEFATTSISKQIHENYVYVKFENAEYQMVNGINYRFDLFVRGEEEHVYTVVVYSAPGSVQNFRLVSFHEKSS